MCKFEKENFKYTNLSINATLYTFMMISYLTYYDVYRRLNNICTHQICIERMGF